ncbi:hypothetical protein [Flavobacterium sp. JP2137]|uniref:hypothetical protein n=1 Tax=Flavobacterium sp. JP2137 TaxID=3414510 RepID=UPI003D300FE4
MEINKEIIHIDKTESQLVLKTRLSENLIKLSQVEFEIIEYYAKVLNKQQVILYYKNSFNIESTQLDFLLEKARENHLLIEKKQSAKNIFIKFRFNKRIFEILVIDFSNSKLENILNSKFIYYSIFFFLVLVPTILCFVLSSKSVDIFDNYMTVLYLVPFDFTNLMVFIIIGSFFGKCVHEFGHYFFYKFFGGKCTIFGFGFLFLMIPIFYNKLYISFIKNKRQKILVYIGGVIFDAVFFISIFLFVSEFHTSYATLSFIGYSIMLSILIRSCFNLNFFLPGSDSYILLNELIGKTNLYEESLISFKEVVNFSNLNFSNIFKALYFVLSTSTIFISWLFFAIPFLMLLYNGIF